MKAILLPGLCLCLLAPFAGRADDTNPPPRLMVELRDSSRLVGKSPKESLAFHSALLGDLTLAVKDIRTVECLSTNSAKLTTASGDVMSVTFANPTLPLTASFGKIEITAGSIRKLSVTASATSAPRHEGLIGFWPGNGNATDDAGNNSGTLVGSVTYATGSDLPAFKFGSPGGSVKIPGTPALDPGNQVTVEFWMKADADNAMDGYQGLVTSDFYGVEISNGYGGPMGVNFFLNTTANQAPMINGRIRRAIGTGFYSETSDANGGGATVSADVWHHVAATYDGRLMRLYIDGKAWRNPVAHSGRITPMSAGSFVAIGSEDGRTASPDTIGNRYFRGQIANVALYNRALTATEIQEDYEAGNTK
ncbi:MAG TPA: LamG domain-containing protein [Verrucomicrobiae bacterium]|nr:LamG domain-containing protein [Verrucomicrobiae bacterium]